MHVDEYVSKNVPAEKKQSVTVVAVGCCSGTAHQIFAAGCRWSEAPTEVSVSGVVGAEARGGGRKAPAPCSAWGAS